MAIRQYHSSGRAYLMNTLTALFLASTVAAAPPELDFAPGHAVAARDTRNLLVSPDVVFDAQTNGARLARSVLVADETGATDYRQTEPISDKVWAKKVFVLGKERATSAELLLF